MSLPAILLQASEGFDPLTLLVLHVRKDHTTRQVSPVLVQLEAGCQVLV